ncbi:integrase [Embleya sp. NPDC056575]|uniref:integrase n=1 Tax=unclassified Embleya TaxID=2699296 RepID=UPI0036A32210
MAWLFDQVPPGYRDHPVLRFSDLIQVCTCCSPWLVTEASRTRLPTGFGMSSVFRVGAEVRVARELVIGDLRVQDVRYGNGTRAWTIVWPEGAVHREADRFLRLHEGSGTQRTYAYVLVDHLRWLERECLPLDRVRPRDLERYMGVVGADVPMPLGEPWRVGKKPYGHDALRTAAACLKGFFLHQAVLGVNPELAAHLDRHRLPTRRDRRRAFLGHVKAAMPANPLAPAGSQPRHPKLLPEGARERLMTMVSTARNRMVVTWLSDGELCGLHLLDLHLRENAACGQCRSPHLHVCHRAGNANNARAKTKHPWRVEDGTVTGGLTKRVGPAMVHLLRVHDGRVPSRREPWGPAGLAGRYPLWGAVGACRCAADAGAGG